MDVMIVGQDHEHVPHDVNFAAKQNQYVSARQTPVPVKSENQMRNVIFAINITLDGCCDHTKVTGNDEIHEYYTHLMRDVDLLVFGRKTYQLMVPFWPDIAKNHSGQTKAMNDFAQAFDSVNKIIVFSQSLDRAEGKIRELFGRSFKMKYLN